LTALDGQTYSLEGTGDPVLAVFFKVSCETCRLTLPYLQKLYDAYPQEGWHLWAVSQDAAAESLAFADELDLSFPILLDEGWRASQAYDPDGVPTHFFIAADGRVARVIPAFQKAALNELSAAIARHLGVEPAIVVAGDDPAPSFRLG
jgi:peroxiredoxin